MATVKIPVNLFNLLSDLVSQGRMCQVIDILDTIDHDGFKKEAKLKLSLYDEDTP